MIAQPKIQGMATKFLDNTALTIPSTTTSPNDAAAMCVRLRADNKIRTPATKYPILNSMSKLLCSVNHWSNVLAAPTMQIVPRAMNPSLLYRANFSRSTCMSGRAFVAMTGLDFSAAVDGADRFRADVG